MNLPSQSNAIKGYAHQTPRWIKDALFLAALITFVGTMIAFRVNNPPGTPTYASGAYDQAIEKEISE